MPKNDQLHRWSIKDALDTYGVRDWGRDYFDVNDEGHLVVKHHTTSADIKVLVDQLVQRGVQLPLLLRFSSLLESRLRLLNETFQTAIQDYGYRGRYRGVYPIKVNQARKVVDEITRLGRDDHYGLEAGSKPELLAVMAMLDDPDAMIVCNGYKDVAYIEAALLASKLGPMVVLVVEKPAELDKIKQVSRRLGVRPCVGIRIRLTSRGAGRWESSTGDRAKFGLSADEALRAVQKLKQWEMIDDFRLLHFHLGSQITAIRSVKDALREASRMYVELAKLGCDKLDHFDVGGGLGVDYDGSQTNFESSMNYSVREYANDIVSTVQDACDSEGIDHPTLVSESGRAVVAYHSVLVVNVIGVSSQAQDRTPEPAQEHEHPLIRNLWEVCETVGHKNLRECYHDALEYKDQVLQAFNLGHLSLTERARCERLFWSACRRMATLRESLTRVPEELKFLDKILSDTYFCNFSMFQSLPDAWAVDQLFPIMPIHRLHEEPTERGILADITCDSDGAIKSFISPRDVKTTLELHTLNDEPYYLGIMLTGAYQEILGDLHNLFGDTHVVHICLNDDGEQVIEDVLRGDTVEDVLRYVNYSAEDLLKRLKRNIEMAVGRQAMTLAEGDQLIERYQQGLKSYTYLE
ncbi:MAG: biosynthetic arginine decarboxylase [Polyangiaceae bacterium]